MKTISFKTISFKSLLLFFMALTASATALSQENNSKSIYVWKDEGGLTQYSDKPPAGFKNAQVRRFDVEERSNKNPPKELVESNVSGMPADGENIACQTAKKNLNMLKDKSRGILLSDPSEPSGRRIMNQSERESAIKKSEAQIVAFCVE